MSSSFWDRVVAAVLGPGFWVALAATSLAIIGIALVARLSGKRRSEREWAVEVVERVMKEMGPPGKVRFVRITGDVRKVLVVCPCGWAGTWGRVPESGACPSCLMPILCPDVPLYLRQEAPPAGAEQEGD